MMTHGTDVMICHNRACAALRNTRALPIIPTVIMAKVVGAVCSLAAALLLLTVTKPSSVGSISIRPSNLRELP